MKTNVPKTKRILSSLCSLAITAAMTANALPLSVFASPETIVDLPVTQLESEILDNDVFYLATPQAAIKENANEVYRLKVGRGGDADSESTALIKIADITAKYGRDYYVRIDGKKLKMSEDNLSLIEMMENSDYEQRELGDPDELASEMENDEELRSAYNDAVNKTMDAIAGQTGLTDKYGEAYEEYAEEAAVTEMDSETDSDITQNAENETEDTAVTEMDSETDSDITQNAENETEDTATPETEETIRIGDNDPGTTDKVQKARSLFLNQDAVAQRVEAAGGDQEQAIQDMQKIADLMTDGIVGANVEITFAPGEKEKYIEIVPIDNYDGDGNKMFYAILGAPTGTTTNSAASSSAFTILDDEEHEASKVSFSAENYIHTPGEDHVTVTIERKDAMNSNISVVLKTTGEGSAMMGRDYSEVERTLLFPFGVSHIIVDIPVRTDYFEGDADFGIELIADTGCEIESGKATVSMTGTYSSHTLTSKAVSAPLANADSTTAESETTESTGGTVMEDLTKVKTYGSLDVSKPYKHGHEDNKYGGHNEYDTSKKWWKIDWEDNSFWYDRKGTVGAAWEVGGVNDFWINGARVKWSRTGNDADIGVLFNSYDSTLASDWKSIGRVMSNNKDIDGHGHSFDSIKNWMTYNSRNNFNETADMYPNGTDISDTTIWFYNHGRCDDCNWLRISAIEPILRPFEVQLQSPDALQFLQEDGTMRADADLSKAVISGGIKDQTELTRRLDDTLTVLQPNGEEISQYTYLSGLNLVARNKTYSLASNTNAAKYTLTWKFSKENLQDMYKKLGNATIKSMMKENKFIQDDNKYTIYGTPRYCDFQIKPEFSYINSKVTLHNPWEFPVVFHISGTDYELNAGESKTLTYHKGDKLYTTFSIPSDAGADAASYKEAGIFLKVEGNNGTGLGGTRDFSNGEGRYIASGMDAKILDLNAVTVEPVLQEKENQILVKVKNSELNQFKATGIFTLESTTDGTYTYFTYANKENTYNGRKYSLSAETVDADSVCLWYDANETKWYEGSTFYFTAGGYVDRNVIELTTEKTNQQASMSGTIRFVNYNQKSNKQGDMSLRAASFAAVSTGLTGTVANEDGEFRTSEFGYFYDKTPRYIRYSIAANGSEFLKEVLLPEDGGNIDVTSTLGEGINPVSSAIFNNMTISASYPESSQYNVANGCQLPIVDLEWVNMEVTIKPSQYTPSMIAKDGALDETKTESPTSVQFVVYDKNGKLKHKYDVCDSMKRNSDGSYTFKSTVDFSAEDTSYETDDGTEQRATFTAEPDDELYIRLVTDREGQDFTYSDVFTGYVFYDSPAHKYVYKQAIDPEFTMQFDELPFLGEAGMDFNFPFVNVGASKTEKGYRMYIGVNVMDIYDKIYDTSYSKMTADDGVDYSDIYSVFDPKNFLSGIGATFKHVFKNNLGAGESGDYSASLGSPQIQFDVMFGVYFEFWNPTLVNENDAADKTKTNYIFAGVGGYIAVSVDFKVSYYFAIPVIWIPAYISLNANAKIMGTFGASKDPTKPEIFLTDTGEKQVDFKSSLSEYSAEVKASALVQVSGGIGLCGIVGLRAYGEVNAAALKYKPADMYSDWGAMIGISVGIIADLFVYSYKYEVAGYDDWRWGSFKEYKDGSHKKDITTATANSGFVLSESGSEASNWLGSERLYRYGLTPSTTQALSTNAYDHSDSQLITMKDGTVVLAFIDSDPEKSPYQRTTLKISVFKNNVWSEPVAISNDGTADFHPSIAETSDGRILAAWVSTGSDSITDETPMADYFKSMEVYAAFVNINEDGSVTPEKPTKLTAGSEENFYDSMPTVVCDMVTGDAIVYYIKSGRTSGDVFDIANPYTNDSVVCYMIYNAEQDTEIKNDTEVTIPQGWLFNSFYNSEFEGDEDTEQFLITNYGGQRFLDSPSFGRTTEDGTTEEEFYAIPDFTAIGYNGLAVYAYTIDKDSSNDTYNDKEIMLQFYNFETHETKYRIQITDDAVADAMPQLFRSVNAGTSTDEEQTHTKLFWYRDNKNICYIDVTNLIKEGVDENGQMITTDGTDKEFTYTDEDGNTVYKYLDPIMVSTPIVDENTANQNANYKVVEDANGSLYIMWTEGVVDEEGNVSSEIFATSLYTSGSESENGSTSAWAKPYQITKDGYFHDEMAATMCNDNLLVVYNRYSQDYVPGTEELLHISDMSLMATTLDACGAIAPENIAVQYPDDSSEKGCEVTLPEAGKQVQLAVSVANNGLTPANGYQLTLYAVNGKEETVIGQTESTDTLVPSAQTMHYFEYTMPDNFAGMYFKAVTREKNANGGYYSETVDFASEPLEQRANYIISNIATYQENDGFHLRYDLTNNGNAAASADDLLNVNVTGPFGINRNYSQAEQLLSSKAIGELEVGETKQYDVIVNIPADMFKEYGFITTSVRAVVPFEQTDVNGHVYSSFADRSTWEHVDFDLNIPIKMEVSDLVVKAGTTAEPVITMELAELIGSNDVTYSVDDTSVARIENGKVLGVSSGFTTLYAMHNSTGVTVTAQIEVTSDGTPHTHHFTLVPEKLPTESEDGNQAYYVCDECGKWFEDEEGTAEIKDKTSVIIPAIVTEPTEETEETGTSSESANPEDSYFAPVDKMCDMAVKDYALKNDVTPAKAEAETNEDGSLSIILSDENGNVLDTYTIDPETGIGTDANGNEVNLPQTGNNSYNTLLTVIGAILLMIAGGFIMIRFRRKKEEIE